MYKPNVFSTSRLADFAILQGLTARISAAALRASARFCLVHLSVARITMSAMLALPRTRARRHGPRSPSRTMPSWSPTKDRASLRRPSPAAMPHRHALRARWQARRNRNRKPRRAARHRFYDRSYPADSGHRARRATINRHDGNACHYQVASIACRQTSAAPLHCPTLFVAQPASRYHARR
jgi:hypothetical protein